MRRALPLSILFAVSCAPSPASPAGLRDLLSKAGVSPESLVDVRFEPTEGGRFAFTASEFWSFLEGASSAGPRCCCTLGTLVLSPKPPRSAVRIMIYDGSGMKVKTDGEVVEFESGALREAVRRRLELSAKL